MLPEDIEQRAVFKPGDVAHYRGIVHKVARRYFRQSTGTILYDLVEVVRPGGIPRHANAVPQEHVYKPSEHTIGFDPLGGNPYR